VTTERTLTGVWHGLYSYPSYLEPVYFVATVIQHGQSFSGSTHEAQFGEMAAPLVLFASLSGERANTEVSFIKTYDGSAGWSHSVIYQGNLNGVDEIEGIWSLPDNWSGRFLMMRGSQATEAEIRRAYEQV
jgi:hypothetical protein